MTIATLSNVDDGLDSNQRHCSQYGRVNDWSVLGFADLFRRTAILSTTRRIETILPNTPGN